MERKSVHFAIRVQKNVVPVGELRPGDVIVSPMEVAFDAIREVKKFHPNAEISVEVEL